MLWLIAKHACRGYAGKVAAVSGCSHYALCLPTLRLATPLSPFPPHTQLLPESVRPRHEEAAEEVYKGVAAPKRKRVDDEPEVTEIPKVRVIWGA